MNLNAMKREILFKNLSTNDRKRRVFSSCVVDENPNFVTTTERKYVYLIRKVLNKGKSLAPQVHIKNERDSVSQEHKFNCLIKGGFYAANSQDLFHIRYAHSLEIVIKSQPQHPA